MRARFRRGDAERSLPRPRDGAARPDDAAPHPRDVRERIERARAPRESAAWSAEARSRSAERGDATGFTTSNLLQRALRVPRGALGVPRGALGVPREAMREVPRRRTSCIASLRVPRGALGVPRGALGVPRGTLEVPREAMREVPRRRTSCIASLRRAERVSWSAEGRSWSSEGRSWSSEGRSWSSEGRSWSSEGALGVPREAMREVPRRRTSCIASLRVPSASLGVPRGALGAPGALLECRGSRCERIRDVGPLASQLPRGAAPRSSRRASPDAQGHGPEPTGRAPDPTRRTPQREFTGRTEGRKRMRSNTFRPSALPVRSLGASSVPWDRGVPSFVAWRTGGLHRGRHGSGSSGVPRVGGRQREARRIVRKYWDARTLRRRPRRYWPSRRKTTPLSPSCRPGVPVLGDGPVRRGCLAPVAGLQATFGKRVASLVP